MRKKCPICQSKITFTKLVTEHSTKISIYQCKNCQDLDFENFDYSHYIVPSISNMNYKFYYVHYKYINTDSIRFSDDSWIYHLTTNNHTTTLYRYAFNQKIQDIYIENFDFCFDLSNINNLSALIQKFNLCAALS